MRIIIAVCSGSGYIPVPVVASLDSLECKYETRNIFFGRQMIDESRNCAIKYALEQKATHLMFIDDDQLFEPDIIDKLLAVDADIACAPVISRVGKQQINIFDEKLERIPIEEFTETREIYACGMGLTLIKCSILEKMNFTYPFMFGAGEIDGKPKKISEDLMFCMRVQDLGGKVVAVKGIKTGHIGNPQAYWYE